MMCLLVIILQYLRMDKLGLVKLSQCLDLIGMIIFYIKIQWQAYIILMEVSNQRMEKEIHSYKTNKNMELFHEQLKVCFKVFLK